MRRSVPLPFVLLATSALAAVPAPERALTDPMSISSPANPQATPVPIADLFYTRSNPGSAWSPDGREVVFSTNFSGRYNLWKVDAAGGWPIQLVQSDDRQFGMTWSPDGRWIVFQSDRAGGELYALFAVPAEGGPLVALTNDADATHEDAQFSPDGTLIAFERKSKTASANDVAVLDWKTHAIRQLTHESTKDHYWQVAFWSRDGRSIYANRFNAGGTDASAWRVDVATGKTEELTPHAKAAMIAANGISPDGRWLAVQSNAKDGHDQAALFDLDRHAYRWMTSGPWSTDWRRGRAGRPACRLRG